MNGIVHKFRNWVLRRRRNPPTLYYVDQLAREDGEHDQRERLADRDPTPRWIAAEQGEHGERYWEWRRRRAEPLGRPDIRLRALRKELELLTKKLAQLADTAEEVTEKLNGQRLRWFAEGVTASAVLKVAAVVVIIEAILNYVGAVALPLEEWLQVAFAVFFATLVALPAHHAGIFAMDAILNWDHRRSEKLDERVHHTAVLVGFGVTFGVATLLTLALGLQRDTFFRRLQEKHPDGVFGGMDPTWLGVALLLGAFAGVVAILVVGAKYQAGLTRRRWADELTLTKAERKRIEARIEELLVAIARAEREYDVAAEKHAAEGLAIRKQGIALRAQYDRAWVNTQRAKGRKAETPGPEPEPHLADFFGPIPAVHLYLPALEPDGESEGNGKVTDPEEAVRRSIERRPTRKEQR